MKLIVAFAMVTLVAAPAIAYDPDRDGAGYNGKRDHQYNGNGPRGGYYYGDGWGGRDKRCDVVMKDGKEVRRCW